MRSGKHDGRRQVSTAEGTLEHRCVPRQAREAILGKEILEVYFLKITCAYVFLGRIFVTLEIYTFPSLKTTIIEKEITFKNNTRTVIQKGL